MLTMSRFHRFNFMFLIEFLDANKNDRRKRISNSEKVFSYSVVTFFGKISIPADKRLEKTP